MTAVEKLLSIAIEEIGYLEKRTNKSLDDKFANAGFNNYTKYARDLDKMGVYSTPKNGYAWCDMFCDWCFITAFGLEIKDNKIIDCDINEALSKKREFDKELYDIAHNLSL